MAVSLPPRHIGSPSTSITPSCRFSVELIRSTYMKWVLTGELDPREFNASLVAFKNLQVFLEGTCLLLSLPSNDPRVKACAKAVQKLQLQILQMAFFRCALAPKKIPSPLQVLIPSEQSNQPSIATLMRYASNIAQNYSGFGLERQMQINGRSCDILYFKKRKDQIKFEFPNTLFGCRVTWMSKKRQNVVIETLKKQSKAWINTARALRDFCTQFRYKDFQILTRVPTQKALGIPAKTAQQCHVIILYVN